MKTAFYTYPSHLCRIGYPKIKTRKTYGIAASVCTLAHNDSLIVSEIGILRGLQLKLQFVSDQAINSEIVGFQTMLSSRPRRSRVEGSSH